MNQGIMKNDQIMAIILFLHPDYFKLDEESQERARKETLEEIFDLGLYEMRTRIVFMIDHKDGVA